MDNSGKIQWPLLSLFHTTKVSTCKKQLMELLINNYICTFEFLMTTNQCVVGPHHYNQVSCVHARCLHMTVKGSAQVVTRFAVTPSNAKGYFCQNYLEQLHQSLFNDVDFQIFFWICILLNTDFNMEHLQVTTKFYLEVCNLEV